MLQLLFTKRWLGYLALTVVFAAVATMFGQWQWDRRGQAVAAMTLVETNYDQTPVPLASLLTMQNQLTSDQQWIPVTVEGRYRVSEQILVRTRPGPGSVGFEVLVPFDAEGVSVIVNRGWIPTGESRDFPDVVPQPPTGDVTLIARVKSGEPELRGRGAPEGQIASIHLPSLQRMSSAAIREDFYLALGAENPLPAAAPLALQRPELTEGPHLSYTFQWYLFALMAVVGLVYMLRQELRLQRGEDLSRKPSQDEAEEDALLDEPAR